ncbi:MAG: BMP family ABC transporter substrate-binding protein [Candidatus Izemoplasmatales bacterium]|nr:BMP family ABC transporter substrate-binding protein [Candidatus Izemoplasmatales bacterium]
MRKIFGLITLSLFAFAFVGCGGTTTTAAPTTAATTTEEAGFEIALVTDVGNIDDKSFNEGTWNGVVEYATANNKTYAYYRPTEDSKAARIEAMEAAINNGAKVVVCPGYLFEEAIYQMQTQYPDVYFLLLDGQPHAGDYNYVTEDNTHNVLYQEEQAGFFAGYAAVKEGYRSLGFVGGMAVPAVVRYGYGFVQGAEYAADELGLAAGAVTIKYHYADVFWPDTDLETKMDLWYTAGTEVVFACGGGLYISVVAAAERSTSGVVIGVDVDQKAESDLIITSAMKALTLSVVEALTEFYDAGMQWPSALAGQTALLGAASDGVGLPTNTEAWRFENFTVAQYEAIYALVADGTVIVSPAIDVQPTVTLVTVNYDA